MRLFVYEVLTQLIIWLGNARERLMRGQWVELRTDRTFYASNSEINSCCDCGLEHRAKPLYGEVQRDPAYKLIPRRPKGYQYRLRYFCEPPAKFYDEIKKS